MNRPELTTSMGRTQATLTAPHRAVMTAAYSLTIAALLACADPVAGPTTARTSARSVATSAASFPTELASVAWQAQARSLVASHAAVTPPVATRVYALLGVAQYGAIVDAEKHADVDGVLNAIGVGRGGRSRFESDRAAAAGASVQILTFLFPDAAAGLERRLSDEANAGPGGVQPQFTRGVAIGRAFGDVMVRWAKADGFSKPWAGSVPSGPGLWTPAVGAPLALPQISAMTPYSLTSPAQFHPLAPPAFGSAPFLTDLAELVTIANTRTPAQLAAANFWNLQPGTISVVGHWDVLATQYIGEHGRDERAAAHVFALTNAAALDAMIACWEAKFSYFYIRPSQANSAITLPIGLPNHPSYPSGHSCISAAPVEVLSAFFPEHVADLSAQLAEAGLSRMYAGLHYRFDITAGQALGRAVGRWALAYDRNDGLLSTIR